MKDEKVGRDNAGRWKPGQSGNPSGRPPCEIPTDAEAREMLPQVWRRMIGLAHRDPKFLDRLRKDNPATFTNLLLKLGSLQENSQEAMKEREGLIKYVAGFDLDGEEAELHNRITELEEAAQATTEASTSATGDESFEPVFPI